MSKHWRPAGRHPTLVDDVVHVWWLFLPAVADDVGWVLAPDERARAERFRFDVHRRRFVAARAGLRALIGRYLSSDPRRIQFLYSAHGKPSVDAPISFNLSHAGDLALYAFTAVAAVGVDVEKIDSAPDHDGLAARFFADAEKRHLEALPSEEERRGAFFRCWTRKEAVVKAGGKGLSIPLSEVEVSLDPGVARLVHPNGLGGPQGWTMTTLTAGEGYEGAAAVQRRGADFTYHELDPTSI